MAKVASSNAKCNQAGCKKVALSDSKCNQCGCKKTLLLFLMQPLWLHWKLEDAIFVLLACNQPDCIRNPRMQLFCNPPGCIWHWRMQLWQLFFGLMALPVLYLSTWDNSNLFFRSNEVPDYINNRIQANMRNYTTSKKVTLLNRTINRHNQALIH